MGDAVESYRTELAGLNFNSKPLINMLTMLAEEREQMAPEIVQVIDEQIEKVPANQKLPLLYLIDSMIKNLTSTLYPQLFIQNIIPVFCRVFEEVDEKTRTSMYKLRQTWTKVIPNNKLFALDVRVKRIDPAWPITAKQPDQGSIHVNPKFLVSQAQQQQPQPSSSGENSPAWSSSPQADPAPHKTTKDLQEKEEEIKMLKLELELAQTRAKLEQEKKRLEQKHQDEMAQLRAIQDRVGKETPGSTPPDTSSLPMPRQTSSQTSVSSAAPARPRDPRLSRDPRLASSVANRDPRRRNQPSAPQHTLSTPSPASAVLPFPPDNSKTTQPPSQLNRAHMPLPPDDLSSSGVYQTMPSKRQVELAPVTQANPPMTAVASAVTAAGSTSVPSVPKVSLSKLTDWYSSLGKTGRQTPGPSQNSAPPSEPAPPTEPPKEATVVNIPLPKPPTSPVASKQKPTAKASKPAKKPPKKKEPKSEETAEEKIAAPTKFKINTVEITEPPTPSEKIQQAAKRKFPITVEKRRERSVSPSPKTRKESEVAEKTDTKDRSKERRDSGEKTDSREKEKNSRSSVRDKKSGSGRSRRSSSSPERRDSKEMERSRSSDNHSRSSRERRFSKEKEHHSGSRRDDWYRESHQRGGSFRGRGTRARGSRHRHYSPPHSRSQTNSRSKSHSPIKLIKSEAEEMPDKKMEDDAPAPTPSSSLSDVATSSAQSDAAASSTHDDTATSSAKEESSSTSVSEKELQDVDERPLLKRSAPGEAEQSEELVSQAKKARQSPSEESVPLVPDTPSVETDSKEELSGIFSGEDIDYRQQGVPQSPAPQGVQQSPAQQRWSKFKETHPDDFAMEIERRKSADEVRRASLAAAGVSGPRHENFDRGLQDVDFRKRVPGQSGLPPPSPQKGKEDAVDDIPVALSLENQEEVIMQAEQEVRAGRMSHDEHQTLLRQLGQVYDRQRRQSQKQDSDSTDGVHPRRADPRVRQRRAEGPGDVDHRRHPADSDFRKGSSTPRLEGEDDRNFHHPRREEGDVDLRRHGRPEEGEQYRSPRPDLDSRGSPRPDFDVRGSPREDFDARRGPRPNFEGRDGPRLGPRHGPPRGDTPRDFDGRKGPGHFDGPPEPPAKRPLLGIAPGVPLDGPPMDDRGPPEDFDERGGHWHERPRRDFRGGRDVNLDDGCHREFDDQEYQEDFDHRGPARDFGPRGPQEEFDRRGPPRDFDRRRGPRNDDRRVPPDFGDRGPPDSFHPQGPHRGPARGPPRGRARNFNDHGPPEEYVPEEYDERGRPEEFDERGRFEDFGKRGRRRGPFRGPPRGPHSHFDDHGHEEYNPDEHFEVRSGRDYEGRHSPRDFEEGRSPREYEGRGSRDFDDRRPPRDSRGPSRDPDGPPRNFDGHFRHERDFGPEPPRDFDGPRGPPNRLPMPAPDGRPYNGPGPRGPRPRMDGPRPRMDGPRPFGPQGPRPPVRPEGPGGPDKMQNAMPKIIPGSPMDDPRWSCMRGLLAKEVMEEVVIDGKPYEVKMNVKRMIRVDGREHQIYPDPVARGVLLNGDVVYKFGEPKKDVDLGHTVVEMFYHGPPLSVWIDGQQHRVRIDAPPQSMCFDDKRYGFQIDGQDKMILVDRLEKGILGGPPRPLLLNGVPHEIAFEAPPRTILIDSQSCELKLDRKIPLIIYNGKPHGIRFEGGPRNMIIDDVPYLVPLDRAVKAKIGLRPHFLAFGGPAHEVIIDGKWFEVKFNNVPKTITIGNNVHTICLEPPVPRVKILDEITEGLNDNDLLLGQMQPRQLHPMQKPPLPPHTGPHMPGLQPPVASPAQSAGGPKAPVTKSEGPAIQPNTDAAIKKEPEDKQVKEESKEDVNKMPGQDSTRVVPVTGDSKGPAGPPSQMGPGIGPGPGPAPQGQPRMPPQSQLGIRPQGQQGLGMQRMGGPVMRGPMMTPMMLAMNAGMNMMNMMSIPSTMPQIFPGGITNPLVMQGLQRIMAPQTMGQGMNPQGFPGLNPQAMQQMMGAPAMQRPSSAMNMPVTPAVPTQPTQPTPAPAPTPATAPAPAPTAASAPKPASASAAEAPSVNINDLLSKLLAAGIIGQPAKKEEEAPAESTTNVAPASDAPAPVAPAAKLPAVASEQGKKVVPAAKPKAVQKKEPPLERPPDLSDFQTAKLKKQYSAVVHNLYQGIQCSSCGCRFLMEEMEQYRQHLDWHFRLNKREKEAAKITSHRKWYYELNDWILFQEVDESEERMYSSVFEEEMAAKPEGVQGMFPVKVPEGVEVVYNPPASDSETGDLCAVCGDPFEQYWDEEAEEWHLRNAISISGKMYHPICYDDVREGTDSEVTPTPTVEPAENPLVTQLKAEPVTAAEGTEQAVAASIATSSTTVTSTDTVDSAPISESVDTRTTSPPPNSSCASDTAVTNTATSIATVIKSEPCEDVPMAESETEPAAAQTGTVTQSDSSPSMSLTTVVKTEPVSTDETPSSDTAPESTDALPDTASPTDSAPPAAASGAQVAPSSETVVKEEPMETS